MRELTPYRTVHGLQTAVNNGGRFYNLFSSANDQVVHRGWQPIKPTAPSSH